MKEPNTKDLFTVRETCQKLSIGKTKVWALIGSGKLDAVRLGRKCTRIKNSSIERIVAEGVA